LTGERLRLDVRSSPAAGLKVCRLPAEERIEDLIRELRDVTGAMLFYLIPTVWLGLLCVIVAACRAAADADRPQSVPVRAGTSSIGVRLILPRQPIERSPGLRRDKHRSAQLSPSGSPRRRRAVAHGLR
jgi:hypothetical protein